MTQSSSPAPPVDLDEKIDTAESIFDLSSVTAQLLSKLAGKSSDSAASLATITASTAEAAGYQQKIADSAAESAKSHGEIAANTGESAKSHGAIATNTGESALHLGRVAAHSEHLKSIAEQFGGSTRSLEKISNHASDLSLIAKRGTTESPLHITAELPKELCVVFKQEHLEAITVALSSSRGASVDDAGGRELFGELLTELLTLRNAMAETLTAAHKRTFSDATRSLDEKHRQHHAAKK